MSNWKDQFFHPMQCNEALPATLNNLFSYEPHPLCLAAFEATKPYIDELLHDEREGKMFGFLIVENDGVVGYLAAYSGQIRGRSDWPGFVPAVFDYLQPDGFFKVHEAEITALNCEIERRQQAPERLETSRLLADTKREAMDTATVLNQQRFEGRLRRRELRASGTLSAEEEEELVRESQFMNAEIRRIKTGFRERIEALEAKKESFDEPIRALKAERRQKSDVLQHWLFERFLMLNSQGERKNLNDIFKDTSLGRPPSGAGECCEPKLLQYAYEHGLRPVQMAMFWVGASPDVEIRHSGRHYPACRGKCLPILRWMLPEESPIDMPKNDEKFSVELPVIYEDDTIVVVNKPAGLLSVPGISEYYSVWSIMRERFPESDSPLLAHRLDQPTSGLLLVGKTREAAVELQRQFAEREVQKQYVALLEKPLSELTIPHEGEISLPLYSNPLNRPYQSVDGEHGRPAVTKYVVTGETDGHTRVNLYPKTGRTHQLRVHCAHADGLNNPILGDYLYGEKSSRRLFLHAESIRFHHPATGEELFFRVEADF